MPEGFSRRRVVVGYIRQLLTPYHYDQALAFALLFPLVPFSIFERAWTLAAILAALSLTWLWLTMWRPHPGLDKIWITTSRGRLQLAVDNDAAIGALSKVGFESIGEKERTLGNGTVIDAAIFEHRSPVPDQLIPTVSGATSFDLTPRGWI